MAIFLKKIFGWFSSKKKHWQKTFHKKGIEALRKKRLIKVKGIVKANLLNVRKEPSLNSIVIGQLKKNTIVSVLNVSGDWVQIKWHNTVAYLYKRYVQIVRYQKRGVITARALNVRSAPSKEATILGTIKKGDTVLIFEELNQWYKIQHGTRAAYVYKTYVNTGTIPIKPNIPKKYFYQRKDLMQVSLEASKPLSLPPDYHQKVVVNIWNKFGNLIKIISKELQIDLATIVSVIAVESQGKGFVDGRLLIRFENHIFWLFWGKNNQKVFNKHFKFNADRHREGHYFREKENGKWEVCHTDQNMEWRVLNFAMKLDKENALKSISMGAPQIMGFNHKFIGYPTVEQMFENFKKDIRYHIFALFDFCKAKEERIYYLQKHDFYNFAVEYNGKAAPKAYEARLKKYFKLFSMYIDKI